MVTVVRWTGREVRVLRDVLRMSVREFANHTGLSASAIADMEAKGEQAQPRHATQQILDRVLATAPEEARQRLGAILGNTILQPKDATTISDTAGIVPGPRLRVALVESAGVAAVLTSRTRDPSGAVALVSTPGADVLRSGRDDGVDGVPLQEFEMAAGESARFTRRAGVTVSAELLDQLRSEVRGLAAEYLHRPPYEVFAPISTLRREVFSLLDRHVPTQHLSDLYVCAGQLTALLAHASADLGQPVVAEAHACTAWLCAELAGHDPLRAYVRWVEANIAYWTGQYRQAAEIAAEERRYATSGSGMLRLASQEARAWAACGDQNAVERALMTARDERDRLPDQTDEAGAFRFGAGKAAYYAAEAWLAVGGADNARRAHSDAEEAYALLTAEPQPCPELVAAARLDLATAQVALGQLEAAGSTLTDVFTLPAERRTVPVTQRAAQVDKALSMPEIGTSPVSAGLRKQIRLFLAYPATRELTT